MSFQQISAGKAILILHSKCFFGKSILGGCQFIARFASFLAITNHFYLMIISKLSHLLGARNFTQLAGVPLFGTYSDSNPRLKLSQDLIWEIVSFLGKCTLEVVLFSFFFLQSLCISRFRMLYQKILLWVKFGSLLFILNLLSLFLHHQSVDCLHLITVNFV